MEKHNTTENVQVFGEQRNHCISKSTNSLESITKYLFPFSKKNKQTEQ